MLACLFVCLVLLFVSRSSWAMITTTALHWHHHYDCHLHFTFAFPFSPPICIRSSLFSHLPSRICKKHFVRWLWLKNKHRIVWICVELWWNGSFTKNYFTECQPSKSAMEYNWFNFNHIVMHETYHANDEWLFSIAENCKEEPRIDVVYLLKLKKYLNCIALWHHFYHPHHHTLFFCYVYCVSFTCSFASVYSEKKPLNIVMIYIFKPVLSHYRIRPIANFSFADPSIFFSFGMF